MSIRKTWLVPGLLLLILGVTAGTGNAAPADAATPQQGWFGRQLTNFKSYPHLDMAYRLLRQDKPEEALAEFKRYLDLRPDDAKARSDYMATLTRLGRYDAAQGEARRILKAAPDDVTALLTLGQALARAGDPGEAVAPLLRAAELSRANPSRHREAVMTAAAVLAGLGRNKQALELLDTLPSTQADFAVLQTRGMTLAKTGQTAKARDTFAKALGMAADDAEKLGALRALGVALTELGDNAKARQYLAQARKLAPDDPTLLRQLAVLAVKTGDLAEAERLGRQIAATAPTVDNTEFLATVLASRGKTEAAIDVLWPLRDKPLTPAQAFRYNQHLGTLLLKAGKPGQAVVVLRDAVAIRPDALAFVRLSRAEQQVGHAKEAAKALEEAIALGANPDALVELATLQHRLDDNAAALKTLNEALGHDLAPKERLRTLSMKATLLSEGGEYGAARQTLTEALKSPGDDKGRLLVALGEVCLRLQDYPAAVNAFTQATAAGAGASAKPALAEALVKNNQPEQALDLYASLADKAATPQQRDTYRLSQANVLAGLGRHAQAAALYQALAEGGQPQLYLAAGQSFAAAGEPHRAAQSLGAYAADKDTPVTGKAEALLALGNVYAGERKPAKALTAFAEAAPLASGLSRDKQTAIALGQGTAALLAGKAGKAVAPLRQAVALLQDGAPKARTLLTLAQAYVSLGNRQQAVASWRQAAATPGARGADVATAEANIGNALVQAGDMQGAAAAFGRALARDRANWRLLAALGQVEYTLGHYDAAESHFSRSLALHADAGTRIALGRCYDKLGKPGLALVAFGQAEPDVSALSRQEQRQFHLDTGFLYAAEFRYDAAVTAFKAAMALGYDPENAVRLGRLERLAGQPEAARATLKAVDASKLPRELAILRLSELASLAEAAKDDDTAREYLTAAMTVAPDADTAFRLGNVERDSGHPDAAVDAYRKAVALDDANRYLTALGYAYSRTRKYDDAAKVFETVLSRDEDYLSLWEDLGYAYMHECDNAKAVDRFKKAIDNAPLRPVDSPEDRDKRDKDVYRLRKEVTKLQTHFTTTAYMSYIAGEAGPAPAASGNSPDTIRSGAGAEFAWIPPRIGFRDDRILQLIARFSANFNKDSLEIDDTSWQGAVGLRYKPFKSQNLNVGFERLFKIGRAAEENWLLRGMYSWTDGYDVKPGKKRWNYTFFYGEYDYYMENDPRSMFYAEGRQGITFNLGDRLLVTPHVVADVRWWTPDINLSSLVEGGGGLSVKYLFNRADYEVERSSLEFLLQYKYGRLFNKVDVKDREDIINALFLTTIFKF